MVRGVGRMAADRARYRGPARLVVMSEPMERFCVGMARLGLLGAAFAVGWLFAQHIDPRGELIRVAVAALVGEGR